MDYDKVAGFIGDHFSSTTLPMADILHFYGYSQISYGATNYVLSDRHVYPHFFRMLQNERVYYKIIVQLLRRFGWTWVGILTSADDKGETEQLALANYLNLYDICVDFTIKANMYTAMHEPGHTFDHIIETSFAHVIIICGSYSYMVPYFAVLIAQKFDDKVFIFSPPWTFNDHNEKFDVVASKGNLFIELYPLPLPEIGSFFDNINPSKYPNDMLLEDILQYQKMKRKLTKEATATRHPVDKSPEPAYWLEFVDFRFIPSDPSRNRLSDHMICMSHPTSGSSNLDFTGLGDSADLGVNLPFTCLWLMKFRPSNPPPKLHHYIKNVRHLWQTDDPSFFDEHGEFGFNYLITNWIKRSDGPPLENKVGNFTVLAPEGHQLVIDSQSIFWGTKNNKVPRSQCSDNCLPGSRKVAKPGKQVCCYDCSQCPEGEISNRTDSEICIQCPYNEWPNEKKSQCIPRLEEFLSYNNDTISAVFVSVSVLSFLITFAMLVIFILFRDTPIVKANNRSLSFVILVSILLSFPCVFLFLGRPADVTCMLRQSTFAVIFSIAISSVLAKTVMIYIVFKASKPGSVWSNWISMKVSSAVVLIFSSIQILTNISWMTVSPPFLELDTQSYPGKIIVQCNEGSVIAFYTVLGYMGFLAAVSFIIAYLARTLPDSFNEAKNITFSMLVFCSVWIAMIPAYLSTKGKDMVAVEIFAILASSAGLLGCIFFPKCYMIVFKPEVNTKRALLGSRNK
ncbi:vomeronasal type-2 receptor 26-like [Pelodytes ibericus]